MGCRESKQTEHQVSTTAEVATGYIRRMVEKEGRGWGDQSTALDRLGRRYGLSYWTLNNLRTGRAKTVDAGVFARIRAAYIDLCERELAKLQHELSVARTTTQDDTFEDLAREAEDLASRIAEKKAVRKP